MNESPPIQVPPPVLVAQNLSRRYVTRYSFLKRSTATVLNNVSFSVARGKTLAVVGESGCGKSTLARILTLATPATSGSVSIAGYTIDPSRKVSKAIYTVWRRHVQMVFQHPFASLNPRKTIQSILAEPLIINTSANMTERADHVARIMRTVGLAPEHALRYPHMFSGGQQQRIAIARAMILKPPLLIADEPVSALDVSIQAQILNLFMDLQDEFETSYVFISHNLSVVEHIAHNVMVMYLGSIAEIGEKTRLFARPRHPYTRTLISATPAIHPSGRRIRIPVRGEMPSPLAPPAGCTFHPRCPYVIARCRSEVPRLRHVDGRQVACHRAEDI